MILRFIRIKLSYLWLLLVAKVCIDAVKTQCKVFDLLKRIKEA